MQQHDNLSTWSAVKVSYHDSIFSSNGSLFRSSGEKIFQKAPCEGIIHQVLLRERGRESALASC